jgi:hypothetical protein
MKKITLLFLFNALIFSAFCQLSDMTKPLEQGNFATPSLSITVAEGDTLWTTGGTTGLTFSQVYLQNWAAGGQSSMSANGLFNWYANYAKDKSTWDNTLDLGYGMLWQGDAVGIKTDDKIDFASKYGYKASEHWFYTALANFRTQFAPGYDDPFAHDTIRNVISDFMAPAYALVAIGMDYKPSKNFTAFISPVTIKMTMVNDQNLADAGAFGVEGATYDDLGTLLTAGKNFRSELGGYFKMMYKTELAENVSLQTKLDLFSNYQNNPQNIDVNWETLITMKINDFLSTTITTQVLYDDDINIARDPEDVAANGIVSGPATQFKEVLAIGFSYKF